MALCGTVSFFAPQPVTWKHWGQTERELHCVLVCIFGIRVGASTVGREEGFNPSQSICSRLRSRLCDEGQ